MSSGIYSTRLDPVFKPAGPGSLISFRCLGCDKPRLMDGSRGRSIFKMCAQCLTPKVVK